MAANNPPSVLPAGLATAFFAAGRPRFFVALGVTHVVDLATYLPPALLLLLPPLLPIFELELEGFLSSFSNLTRPSAQRASKSSSLSNQPRLRQRGSVRGTARA